MKKVLIIGSGNLGCRHIQGLYYSDFAIEIHIVDTFNLSLLKCRRFIDSNDLSATDKVINFYDSVTHVEQKTFFDLVIVSTTATQRSETLLGLFKNINSRFWLIEKPLVQSSKQLEMVIDAAPNEGAYVNYARREIEWHQDIKTKYFSYEPVNVNVCSSDLGIACNSSHFVDLINYWTGEFPINLDSSGLEKKWHNSKREGFKEIEGELIVNFSGGSKLSLLSAKNVKLAQIAGTFIKSQEGFTINEALGWQSFQGKFSDNKGFTPQSLITGVLFDKLMGGEGTQLTDIHTAAKCFAPLLKELESHWARSSGRNSKKVLPIT
ncbi:Gfo/Idh/MocA family oxidoreductase [Candidatus Puniceispirillum sp.]|nr:Gfo/Idh/MocA family oxidoreductase [Candidatus Puniceispirillum sp.]